MYQPVTMAMCTKIRVTVPVHLHKLVRVKGGSLKKNLQRFTGRLYDSLSVNVLLTPNNPNAASALSANTPPRLGRNVKTATIAKFDEALIGTITRVLHCPGAKLHAKINGVPRLPRQTVNNRRAKRDRPGQWSMQLHILYLLLKPN